MYKKSIIPFVKKVMLGLFLAITSFSVSPLVGAQIIDIDGDGIADVIDIDKDGDGITDSTELPAPVSAVAKAAALSWIDSNSYEVFAISNPDVATAGYIESGFARALETDGFNIQTTTVADFVVDKDGDTAQFTGGDIELIDDLVDNPEINLNSTTDNNWRSGNTGNSVLVSVLPGANSSATVGPVVTIKINFDSPVMHFGLDVVDFLDAGATGVGNNSSNIEFDLIAGSNTDGEQLVMSIDTGLVGDDELGNVTINGFDNTLDQQGSLYVGQGLETSLSFHSPKSIDYVKIVYRYMDDSVSSLDFLGLDNFVFAGSVLRDTDSDGVADQLDLDSDNDGISDLYESGAVVSMLDINADGTIDLIQDSGLLANSEASNGLDDRIESAMGVAGTGTTPVDTFNTAADNLADYLDLDSDDDGIPDAIEARPTAAYTAYPDLTDATDDDMDNDGILDIFDVTTAAVFGGDVQSLSNPNDADGDLIPDYLDTNSDKDDQNDNAEGGSLVTGVVYTNPDGNIVDPSTGTVLPLISGTAQVAYRGYVIDLVDIANAQVNENSIYTATSSIFQEALPAGVSASALEYTLTGEDAASFTVSASGVVSMVARNYEIPVDGNTDNIYQVGLIADGPGEQSDTVNWTVTVEDISEVVNFTVDVINNTNINENTVYTSVVPALSGDAPIGEITYSLSGTDVASFTIDSATGVVSMIARDYESSEDTNSDNSYDVIITATDDDNNNDSQAWVVTVEDVQEVVNFSINNIANASINENGIYTSVTPTLSGDAPIGKVTYSLSGPDASLVNISADTGVVTLSSPDFEVPADANNDNRYEVSIIATDADGNSAETSWTISITDIQESINNSNTGNTNNTNNLSSGNGGGGSAGLFLLLALSGLLGLRRR